MNVTIHVHGAVTVRSDPAIEGKLDSVIEALHQLKETIMATLDDTLVLVTAQDTKIDSLLTLFDGFKQQLADALAGAKLSPANQAKVDAIFDQATRDVAKIDAALAANTPP